MGLRRATAQQLYCFAIEVGFGANGPACLGLTSIVSLGIMCVWALGQAVQTLSH